MLPSTNICLSFTSAYMLLSLYLSRSKDVLRNYKQHDWHTYVSHSRTTLSSGKRIHYKRSVTTNNGAKLIEFHIKNNEELSIEEVLKALIDKFEIGQSEIQYYRPLVVNNGAEIILTREIMQEDHDRSISDTKLIPVNVDNNNSTLIKIKKILGWLTLGSVLYCAGREIYDRYLDSNEHLY